MISRLVVSLSEVQGTCTGIYQPYFDSRLELVIEEDEATFKTLTIGDLFGLQTSTYSTDQFGANIKHFPGGKSLSEMMYTPHDLHEWYSENFHVGI